MTYFPVPKQKRGSKVRERADIGFLADIGDPFIQLNQACIVAAVVIADDDLGLGEVLAGAPDRPVEERPPIVASGSRYLASVFVSVKPAIAAKSSCIMHLEMPAADLFSSFKLLAHDPPQIFFIQGFISGSEDT